MRPLAIRARARQLGHAIGGTIDLVKLMGKFMERDVVPIIFVAATRYDAVPCEHNTTRTPALAEST